MPPRSSRRRPAPRARRLSPLLVGALLLAACSGTIGDPSGREQTLDSPPGTQPPNGQSGQGGQGSPTSGQGGTLPGGSGTTGAAGSGTAGAPPTSQPAIFSCDEGALPGALPLRRLSRRQYTNSMHDLLQALVPSQAAALLPQVDDLIKSLPQDAPTGTDKHYGGFTSLDQAIQQGHTDGSWAVASGLGKLLTATPERLSAVVGACALQASDDACLTTFLTSFGLRALRRPLDADDLAFYKQAALKTPYVAADYADVISLVLSAPETMFLVEHGDESSTQQPAPLTGYELASRLSYHFWQTAPDELLLARAKSGELQTEAGYQAEVERVFTDPRTRQALSVFFDEWLRNTTLEQLDARVGSPIYDTIRGDLQVGPETRQHYFDDVTDAARYYTFDHPASFDAFFQSTKSFARTEELAKVYGVSVWDGVSEPPDAPGRAGLITRPALVATGTTGTRPIMKGVFIRKNLLCEEIPPPPGNAAANPPPLDPNASTRDVIENLTAAGNCPSCHHTLINPLGFATENFDAFGRLRTSELLFDAQGNHVGSVPVKTDSVPLISASDDLPSSGAGDLTQQMLASPKLHACFARQYFRYTFARLEKSKTDGCGLRSLEDGLRQGENLAQVLRSVALHKSFTSRSFD